MAEVKVNYTVEATKALVEAYVGAEGAESRTAVVEAKAVELGRNVASIRAKLVAEGVYVAAKRVAKRGKRKSELVTALANTLGVSEEVIGSFEKATGTALTAVIGAVGKIKYEAEKASK